MVENKLVIRKLDVDVVVRIKIEPYHNDRVLPY